MSLKKWYHVLMSIIWEHKNPWQNLSKDAEAQRIAKEQMNWQSLSPLEKQYRQSEFVELAQQIKERL